MQTNPLTSTAWRRPPLALLVLVGALASPAGCTMAPPPVASPNAMCSLPVVHHADCAFRGQLRDERALLPPGSAYEQILTEHITLQDAIEAGCGHVLGSRAAPPRCAWEKQ